MIPSAILYIVVWIFGSIFAFGLFAAMFTWLVVRKPDDYEPIENGGDDE